MLKRCDDKAAKGFIVLAISLNVLHIHFDDLMKNKCSWNFHVYSFQKSAKRFTSCSRVLIYRQRFVNIAVHFIREKQPDQYH